MVGELGEFFFKIDGLKLHFFSILFLDNVEVSCGAMEWLVGNTVRLSRCEARQSKARKAAAAGISRSGLAVGCFAPLGIV